MYNGIGLNSARGSGTNGYVQRSLSHVPTKQKRIEYKTEDDLKRLDAEMTRGPNPEILQHARKRQIELKCLEMRELMEEQSYPDDEIESKVAKFRKMLYEKEASLDSSKVILEKDEFGRPIARDSHEIAQAQAEKNRRFKEALGISADYVEGSSLEKLSKRDEAKPEPKLEAKENPFDNETSKNSSERAEESGSETSVKQSKKRKKDKKEKSKKKSHKKSRARSPESSSSDREADVESRSKHKHVTKGHEASRPRSRSPSKRSSSHDDSSHEEKRTKHKSHRH